MDAFYSLLFDIVVVCVVCVLRDIMLGARLVASCVISFFLLVLGLWLLFDALVVVFSGFGLDCVWVALLHWFCGTEFVVLFCWVFGWCFVCWFGFR